MRKKESKKRKRRKEGPKSFNSRARHILRKVWGEAWRGLYEPINVGRLRMQYQAQGACCAICASAIDYGAVSPAPLSLSLDHVIALASGGTHRLDNIQPTHFICNSRKGMTRAA
jgi:5-methylcytosine-specific restriction endonuclease McrA